MNSLTRLNNFNLLRFVFALLVILSHAPELTDGNRSREILTSIFHTISFGEMAVDGFFLLSGYLIVQSWIRLPKALPFFIKRILRIYPGFIVATCVCIFIVGPMASDQYAYFSQVKVADVFLNSLLLQPPFSPSVFVGTKYAALNGAMWTIGYEFMCYLIVILLGIIGAIRNRWVWLLITITIALTILLRNMGYATAFYFYLMPPELAYFFFTGGSFYLFRDKFNFKFKSQLLFLMTTILLLGMFSTNYVIFILGIAGGVFMFNFSLRQISWLLGFNKLPDISYGIYLYGWPIQKLYLWYYPLMSPWILFIVSGITSLFFGLMSWYIIENPCLNFKLIDVIKKNPSSANVETNSR